ncbi:MAG: hypothetical protein KDA69_11760 [Planctomycetaceae bacterium]|nr:hypothetical protein [Planctomycetaceae bacterium]
MILLKIENSQGYFLNKDGHYDAVDKITKEDLLHLVETTLQDPDVSFDEYNVESLKNQAHQIIYKSLFAKLRSLSERREEFQDESDRLFLQDYEKYRQSATNGLGGTTQV